MGSNMKPTIFNDRVAKALRIWHHAARKQIKNRQSGSVTPSSSRISTPVHDSAPVHLLPYYKSELDSANASSRISINNHDDLDGANFSFDEKDMKV